jgi:hypothetical protein
MLSSEAICVNRKSLAGLFVLDDPLAQQKEQSLNKVDRSEKWCRGAIPPLLFTPNSNHFIFGNQSINK